MPPGAAPGLCHDWRAPPVTVSCTASASRAESAARAARRRTFAGIGAPPGRAGRSSPPLAGAPLEGAPPTVSCWPSTCTSTAASSPAAACCAAAPSRSAAVGSPAPQRLPAVSAAAPPMPVAAAPAAEPAAAAAAAPRHRWSSRAREEGGMRSQAPSMMCASKSSTLRACASGVGDGGRYRVRQEREKRWHAPPSS